MITKLLQPVYYKSYYKRFIIILTQKIQQKMINLVMNNQFPNDQQSLKQQISQKFATYTIVQEMKMIADQNNLLNDIKNSIMRNYVTSTTKQKDQIDTQTLLCDSNIKSLQNFSIYQDDKQQSLFSSIRSSIRSNNKFTEELDIQILENALKQVQINCSDETYYILTKATQNKKALEFYSIKKKLIKSMKQIQELNSINLSLHKQKTNINWQLNLLKPKIITLEQQKLKIKKQLLTINKKQQMLSKIQISILMKQKFDNDMKKRYQCQQSIFQQQKQYLKKSYQQFWNVYEKITEKCQNQECNTEKCWKKDAMKICKERLMELKRIMNEQSQIIQKEVQSICEMSNKFKELLKTCKLN